MRNNNASRRKCKSGTISPRQNGKKPQAAIANSNAGSNAAPAAWKLQHPDDSRSQGFRSSDPQRDIEIAPVLAMTSTNSTLRGVSVLP